MFSKFKTVLNRRPLLTQMITSGLIAGGGDAVSQLVFEKRDFSTYDIIRSGRFAILTAGFIAPCLNKWFGVLELVRKGNPKYLPLKRVIIDQTTFSPVFNGIILLNLRLLEGFSFQESFDKMKNDWFTIYTSSLMLWPPVQLLNFYLVPLNMRVIVVQLVAFFWNSYLSYKTQIKLGETETPLS